MPYIWNILYIFVTELKHLAYENSDINTIQKKDYQS